MHPFIYPPTHPFISHYLINPINENYSLIIRMFDLTATIEPVLDYLVSYVRKSTTYLTPRVPQVLLYEIGH